MLLYRIFSCTHTHTLDATLQDLLLQWFFPLGPGDHAWQEHRCLIELGTAWKHAAHRPTKSFFQEVECTVHNSCPRKSVCYCTNNRKAGSWRFSWEPNKCKLQIEKWSNSNLKRRRSTGAATMFSTTHLWWWLGDCLWHWVSDITSVCLKIGHPQVRWIFRPFWGHTAYSTFRHATFCDTMRFWWYHDVSVGPLSLSLSLYIHIYMLYHFMIYRYIVI